MYWICIIFTSPNEYLLDRDLGPVAKGTDCKNITRRVSQTLLCVLNDISKQVIMFIIIQLENNEFKAIIEKGEHSCMIISHWYRKHANGVG